MTFLDFIRSLQNDSKKWLALELHKFLPDSFSSVFPVTISSRCSQDMYHVLKRSIVDVHSKGRLTCFFLYMQTQYVTRYLQCSMRFQAPHRQATEPQSSTRVNRASHSAMVWKQQVSCAMAWSGQRLQCPAKVAFCVSLIFIRFSVVLTAFHGHPTRFDL